MRGVKRIVVFLLMAAIIFSSDSVAMAANTVVPSSEKEKVIKISSVKKLLKVADDLSANYQLTKDLDLSDAEWEALGSKDKPFTGSFDGDGHTISNMHMELAESEDSFVGLFGVTEGAWITNVALENVEISGMETEGIYAGAVAGKMTNSVIENCYASGKIFIADTTVYTVGGLAGAIFWSNRVSGAECRMVMCVADMEISVDENGHGEVGELLGYVQDEVELENSYSYREDYALTGVNAKENSNCKILSDGVREKELLERDTSADIEKEELGKTSADIKEGKAEAVADRKEKGLSEINDKSGLLRDNQKTTLKSAEKTIKASAKASSGELISADGLYNYTLDGDNATVSKYNGDANRITLPRAIDGHSVTGIGDYAFDGCEDLTDISLPESLVSIGCYAFRDTKIKSITIPKNVRSSGHSGTSRNGALAGATSLNTVVFEDGIKKIPDYICGSEHSSSYITKVVIPDSVTEIGQYAFYKCTSLPEVDIPKEVSSIGWYAFKGCTSLTGIIMHYNDTLINTGTEGTQPFRVTIGNSAFSGCSELTNVDLSENVTSIGDYAFSECKKLESLILPESLTHMGCGMISGTWVNSITIPKNVRSSGHSGTSRNGALAGATSLNTVVFEDGIKKIPDYICGSEHSSSYITKVVIPDSVTEIGQYAFYNCKNITIYGYQNSYAETYANENNIPFMVVGVSETATATDVYKKFKSNFKIEGTKLEGDKIYGPEITVAGKTFHVFAVDANLEMSLGDTIQAVVDTDKKRIEVLLGFENYSGSAEMAGYVNETNYWSQSYQQVKDLYQNVSGKKVDSTKLWNKFSAVRGKLRKVDASLGLNASASIAGYMEFSYASGEFVFNEGGAVLFASLGTEVEVKFPPCSAFYATLGFQGDLEGGIRLARQKDSTWHPIMNAGVDLTLTFGVGAGSKKIKTYAEGGIQGKLELDVKVPAANLSEALMARLAASLYFDSKVFGFDGPSYGPEEFASVQLYPRTNRSQSLFDGKDLLDFDLETATLSKRGHANSLYAARSGDSGNAFNQSGIYEYCVPQLAELNDGTRLLVWVDDNGEKSGINKTSLMYAVYDGKIWSSPMAVAETGSADNYPVIFSDGEKVQVVWQKAAKLSDENSLPELLETVELYSAVYADGAFGEVEPITSANKKYEMLQSVAVFGSEVAVVWVENSENNPFQTEGTNSIKMRQKINGSWTESTVVTNLPNVDNLRVAYIGGKLVVSYETNENSAEKIHLIYNGKTKTINGFNADIEAGLLYYQTEQSVKTYDVLGDSTETIFSGVLSDITVLDDGIHKNIVTTEYDGYCSELVLYRFDRTTGFWSDAIKLTDEGKYIRDYSAVMDADGNIQAAVNLVDVNKDSDWIYGAAELRVFGCTGMKDLIIGRFVAYNTECVQPGTALPLTFEVTNNGTEAVSEIQVELLDQNDHVIQSGNAACAVTPGDTVEVSYNYEVPVALTKHTVKVRVSQQGETKLSDNTVATELGYADIIISNIHLNGTNSNAKLIGIVSNIGYEDAADVKAYVYADSVTEGELLGEVALGKVVKQGSASFEVSVPSENLTVDISEEGKALYAKVETSSVEASEGNNQGMYLVKASSKEPIAMNYHEVSLKRGETLQLEATYSELVDLSAQTVSWSVDDASVVSVNDGMLTANSAGTATVTANAGGREATCKVTVYDVAPVMGIYLSEASVTVEKGSTKRLSAQVLPTDAVNQDITWESGDQSVATVNKSGVVTGISAGTTEITAYSKDGGFPAVCKVTVTQSEKGTFTASFQSGDGGSGSRPNSITEQAETEFKLPKNTFTNGSAQFLGWSDGETVYEAGTSYRMPYHNVVFTAVWSRKESEFKKIQGITLSMSQAVTSDGKTVQLTATVKPDDAENKKLKWTSDNESVATVDSNGLVTAVGEGKATITASSTDGSNISASCVISVTKQSGGSGSSTPTPPTNPGTPTNPNVPTTPGTPTNPSTPTNPGTPTNPSQPGDSSLETSLLYYIVKFDANGGKNLSRKTMTLLNDDNLGILPKTTRKNYTFKGWYTQKTGGKKVTKNTVLNAATTLYAQWTKVTKPAQVLSTSLEVSKKGQLTVSVKKVKGATGYEIAYSTNKKFPASATKKVRMTALKKTLKNLKSGKTYYVKIRAYKTDSSGNRVYGAYSLANSIEIL